MIDKTTTLTTNVPLPICNVGQLSPFLFLNYIVNSTKIINGVLYRGTISQNTLVNTTAICVLPITTTKSTTSMIFETTIPINTDLFIFLGLGISAVMLIGAGAGIIVLFLGTIYLIDSVYSQKFNIMLFESN